MLVETPTVILETSYRQHQTAIFWRTIGIQYNYPLSITFQYIKLLALKCSIPTGKIRNFSVLI